MQARVTAVLVARNGAKYLGRTLPAIEAQSRRPDALVLVDAASTDSTAELLSAAPASFRVATRSRAGFGAGVAAALRAVGERTSGDDWLWLLGHDSAPAPTALEQLLAAVEIAPSVAVAGPKVMRWDSPEVIARFGESVTPLGTTLQLVTNELDQGQHDRRDDVLAVSAQGMLVRRSVWENLGGFDPRLSAADDALDFCIRARLAGHRVVAVPEARVMTAASPLRPRAVRTAQLHRRLVYAPAWALPLHWLSLVPLAAVRSVWLLAVKRPLEVPGEFGAALSAVADPTIVAARTRLGQSRRLGWDAIDSLKVHSSQARELAANRAAHDWVKTADAGATTADISQQPRPGFFGSGGAWTILLLAVIGIISFAPLLNASALSGGGLLPLSALGQLWSNPIDADPFTFVLATLGSLTFWSPSASIVGLYLVAIPLAGLAAWACAARFSTRGWAPLGAAVLWALAPSFLASLHAGHLGAALAHLLLPWLVLAVVGAARSWSASGGAALLFAAVVASAPILAPALVLAVLAWAFANPRSLYRTLGIPLPTALLFAPLIAAHLARGDVLALLAEPGVPVVGATTSGWQLALGSPGGGSNGWDAVTAGLGLPHAATLVTVAALLAPLAALAILAMFLPGSRRAVPLLALSLLGFLLAVLSVHIEVSHVGSTTIAIWPGAALALYWFGLVGSAIIALEALGAAAILPALLASGGAIALAVPLLAAPLLGLIQVHDSDERLLPAFVTAEAATQPSIGTLELTAQPDGRLAAMVHRGAGTTLDEQSTLRSTATATTPDDEALAELAGNLSSRSGFDSAAQLERLGIGFVLVPAAPDDSADALSARTRAVDALDSNDTLVAIGETENGYLWRYAGTVHSVAEPTSNPLWLTALGIVFGAVAITSLPTGLRLRRTADDDSDSPADTFEEDDSA